MLAVITEPRVIAAILEHIDTRAGSPVTGRASHPLDDRWRLIISIT